MNIGSLSLSFFHLGCATSRETMTTSCSCCHFLKLHCCIKEMTTMSIIHCCHLFFHVKCCLHQGDNYDECAFIFIISFLILGIVFTKETMMMNARSSLSSFF